MSHNERWHLVLVGCFNYYTNTVGNTSTSLGLETLSDALSSRPRSCSIRLSHSRVVVRVPTLVRITVCYAFCGYTYFPATLYTVCLPLSRLKPSCNSYLLLSDLQTASPQSLLGWFNICKGCGKGAFVCYATPPILIS